MSKEKLDTNKAALELLLSETADKHVDYQSQIAQIDKDLKNLGKIALPTMVFDDIYEAIDTAVNEFDWSDEDNFSKEYSIDYDNRIQLDNLELNNSTDLVEMIVEKVSKLFTEMDCPEDTPEKVKYDDELNK